MQSDERQGTFTAILQPHPQAIRDLATALRELIDSLHPDCLETPRLGERGATYGVGPKKMTQAYAFISPLKTSVNLGLYHGVALPDPAGLLEGTGKRARHVKFTRREEVDRPAIKALLKAAIRERLAAQ